MAFEDLTGLPAAPTSMVGAVDAGIQQANAQDDERVEKEQVEKLRKEYVAARAFDECARKRYAENRAYASGKALKRWYSTANLIASFIDILVSFLYAKDPDVSVQPAKQVVTPRDPPAPPVMPGMPGALPVGGPEVTPPALPAPAVPPLAGMPPGGAEGAPPVGMPGVPPMLPVPPAAIIPGGTPLVDRGTPDSKERNAFAQTMALVIQRLWKDARLKHAAKKQVRSALTVDVGWFKAVMFSNEEPNPQTAAMLYNKQTALRTANAKIAQLQADSPDYESSTANVKTLQTAIAALESGKMRMRYGQHIDFCRAEDIQVSLDVASTDDYRDAGWISQDIYTPKCDLATRFQNPDGSPRFSEDELRTATVYFQRQSAADADESKDGEGSYSKTRSSSSAKSGDGKDAEFCKIVELWDKRENLIKTFVEGIDKWAVEPYPPQQASTRFYSFFRLAFYEVDGERHPQSMPDRLEKQQDEYSATRSGARKTRERSVPGVMFNKGMVAPESVERLEKSEHGELIGIDLTNQQTPIGDAIAPKPMPTVDPRLWDTTATQADMEKLSGVQEALQSSVQVAKTATEANIQQTGFSSRTSADRDTEEDVFTDLATYTAETAIQTLPIDYVQKIAGPEAFWPMGMDIDDVFTMLSIEITAGTTGKPKAEEERRAWATILPMLTKMVVQIRQMELTDPPLATALRNMLRETVRRLDDRIDVEQFLAIGPPPLMPALPPPGGEGGSDNMPDLGSQPGSAGVPPPAA